MTPVRNGAILHEMFLPVRKGKTLLPCFACPCPCQCSCPCVSVSVSVPVPVPVPHLLLRRPQAWLCIECSRTHVHSTPRTWASGCRASTALGEQRMAVRWPWQSPPPSLITGSRRSCLVLPHRSRCPRRLARMYCRDCETATFMVASGRAGGTFSAYQQRAGSTDVFEAHTWYLPPGTAWHIAVPFACR